MKLSCFCLAHWKNVYARLAIIILFLSGSMWAQDSGNQQSPRGSSPFAAPQKSDTVFVLDIGPDLDTGCTFRSGGPLEIQIEIDRYVGEVDGQGFLTDPFGLIGKGVLPARAKLRLPAFDVDFNIPADMEADGVQPERDVITVNGKTLDATNPSTYLQGSNNVWVMNEFSIPIEYLKFPADPGEGGTIAPAVNRIVISIDDWNQGNFIAEGPVTRTPYFTSEFWCTSIDWVSIEFNAWRPVLHLHGLFGKPNIWDGLWRPTLEAKQIKTAAFQNGKVASIQANAVNIATEVNKLKDRYGVESVHIVSHSKGGLDSREHIQGHDDIKRQVMIATPNGGSPLADIAQGLIWTIFGTLPTIIADLAAPAGYQLTTVYMAAYNLSYTPNPNTKYVAVAGNYDEGGLVSGSMLIPGPDDTIVPVWSVYVLPFTIDHPEHVSSGSDTSATHSGMHQDLSVFNSVSPHVTKRSSPLLPPEPFTDINRRQRLPRYLAPKHSNVPYRWIPRTRRTMGSGIFNKESNRNRMFSPQVPSELQSPKSISGAVQNGAVQTEVMTISAGTDAFLQILWGEGDLDLVVIDPLGNRIDSAAAATNPDVEFVSMKDVLGLQVKGFQMTNYTPGDWTYEITGVNVTPIDGEVYIASAFITGSDITLEVTTNFDLYRTGEIIEITAIVQDQSNPVTDATATAHILLPDATVQTVTLFDDGTNGDPVAGDGQYFSQFTNTTQAGVYRVSVEAERISGQVFSREGSKIVTVSESLSEFNGSFGDAGFDADADGLFDELRVQVGVTIAANGDYSIKGELVDNGNNVITIAGLDTTLLVGTHTLELHFDGFSIFSNGVNGPYTVEQVTLSELSLADTISLIADYIPVAHTTAAYLSTDFDRPDVLPTGAFGDVGVDLNGNGKFDQLDVTLDVEITNAATYNWTAILADLSGQKVSFATNAAFLSAGVNTVSLSFPGREIHDHGVDGPYILTGLIFYTSTEGFAFQDVDTTQFYNVTQFEGSRISGVVTNANTGAGFDGATVRIVGSETFEPETKASGDYNKGGILNGTYEVFATAPNYPNSDTVLVTLPPDATVNFTLSKPTIDVASTGISVNLTVGEVLVESFTISNNGATPLNYAVFESPSIVVSRPGDGEIIRPNSIPGFSGEEVLNSLLSGEEGHLNQPIFVPEGHSTPARSGIDLSGKVVPNGLTAPLAPSVPLGDSLFYDNFPAVTTNGIGFGVQTTPVFAAMRFTPTSDFKLSHIRALYQTTGIPAPVHLRIHEHDPITGLPGNVILSRELGDEFRGPLTTFHLIPLEIPILFAAGQEFWVVLGFDNVPFPMAASDNGVNNAGRSFISSNGISWSPLGDVIGDGNEDAWVIRALSPADIPWVEEFPDAGTIQPGETRPIFVRFDAAGLTPGAYTANLAVANNDLSNPQVVVPITMNVVSAAADIGGNLAQTISNTGVSNTTMTLSGDSSAALTSDANGDYLFNNLQPGLNYTVTPSKTGDIGPFSITCFDASFAAQHAVGLITLSPDQVIAADVDEDGNVLAFDAALICSYAIGLPPFDPSDHSGEWRFNPVSRSYTPLMTDQLNQDFSVYLLGDVDGSWTPVSQLGKLSQASVAHIRFDQNPLWSENGREVITTLKFDGENEAYSYQLDIHYNDQAMHPVEVSSSLNGWNLMKNTSQPGRIQVGMYSATPNTRSGEMLRIKWEIINSSLPLQITMEKSIVNLEVQPAAQLELHAVPRQFALHQNYPNPFNGESKIRFDIPQTNQDQLKINLAIYNVNGQLVRMLVDDKRSPGFYEVNWDGRDDTGNIAGSGVYFYVLTAGDFRASKKMIFVK